MTWYQAVLLVGATWRGTLLVTKDDWPFGPVRRWLDRSFTGSLVDLAHCPWCISMYLAALFTVLTLFFWWPWQYFELVFLASAVTGFLGERS